MYFIVYPDGSDRQITIEQLCATHQYTVLYFYPKDCTSGCTVEAVEFSQFVDDFAQLGAQVVGVSKDSIVSHRTFITGSELQIPLISDPDTTLHQQFGAWGERSMYGRTYMGAIRSTFVLDKSGIIITQYDKVVARGHAKKVLQDLRALI